MWSALHLSLNDSPPVTAEAKRQLARPRQEEHGSSAQVTWVAHGSSLQEQVQQHYTLEVSSRVVRNIHMDTTMECTVSLQGRRLLESPNHLSGTVHTSSSPHTTWTSKAAQGTHFLLPWLLDSFLNNQKPDAYLGCSIPALTSVSSADLNGKILVW